ncbi:hypothetical protein PEC18_12295 [Paucibacter sp. O1-1]|nr:hypothetical protein [Paucibacter sp. O1-1]MDA3826597.1 hypothetical protein [Paucibacter sp. O1-1]
MNEDEQTLLLIKGAITEATPLQQQTINACAQDLRDRIKLAEATEQGMGIMAFALVGAEVQLGRLS